jgi:hypothetical protein
MKNTVYGEKPQAVKIAYGSGEVVGFAVHDTLKFGSVDIASQAFIIVEDASLPEGRSWDGICGLGWKALSQFGTTLYENIRNSGNKAVFAIVPAAAASAFPTGQSQAHLLIGEVPEASYEPGTLAWTPAVPFDPSGSLFGSERTFWVIDGGLQINRPEPVPARFLVDTGTNQVLLVPPKYYQNFIRSLIPPAAFDQNCGHDPRAGVVCDCAIQNEPGLKPLKITFGGRAFALPVSEMFVRLPASGGGDLCLLTVQPNHMGGGGMGSMGGLEGILGGLMGSLFGPSGGSGIASHSVIPSRSGPEALPAIPSRALGDLHERGAAIATTRFTGGRVCKTSTVIHNGTVMSQEDSPDCDGAVARQLTAESPIGSILGSILGSSTPGEGTGVQGGTGAPAAPEPTTGQASAMGPILGGLLGSIHGSIGEGSGVQGGTGSPAAPEPAMGQPSAMDEPWMMGGVFLEHFVTIFDFDNARMGFAEPAQARRRLNEVHV